MQRRDLGLYRASRLEGHRRRLGAKARRPTRFTHGRRMNERMLRSKEDFTKHLSLGMLHYVNTIIPPERKGPK
jgi:hypothetical protein